MTKQNLALAGLAISLSWVLGLVTALPNAKPGEPGQEMAGIEKLHRQDVAATLSSDPKALADLWTDDAVRLEPGGPAEIGKPLIRANDEKDIRQHPEAKVLTYAPEIKDVKVTGEWAFEWGYFSSSYRDSPTGQVKEFRGKLLRVLRRQNDGSWKFARVMWNLAQ